jgi:hypothetical protein
MSTSPESKESKKTSRTWRNFFGLKPKSGNGEAVSKKDITHANPADLRLHVIQEGQPSEATDVLENTENTPVLNGQDVPKETPIEGGIEPQEPGNTGSGTKKTEVDEPQKPRRHRHGKPEISQVRGTYKQISPNPKYVPPQVGIREQTTSTETKQGLSPLMASVITGGGIILLYLAGTRIYQWFANRREGKRKEQPRQWRASRTDYHTE